MIALAGAQKAYLTETGSPSGGCGASPESQRALLQTALGAWQARAAEMPLLQLVWLHDLPKAEVDAYRGYYGVADVCFTDDLPTLSLRGHDGADKPGFAWLRTR